MVTHIVLFKLADTSAESIARTCAILLGMRDTIEVLKDIEVGVDALHTERSYDLALVTRFDSWDDYRAYRSHPYHIDPVLKHMHDAANAAAVVDYETP
jgi:hypothetical protein